MRSSEYVNVSECLLDVRARMGEMALIFIENKEKAKATMKSFYDRLAKAKTFIEGAMVLLKKPGLQSKLGDSWEGPYQELAQVSPVTYKIEVPGKSSKKKVFHCNMLRRWHTPASMIHRIVAITEEEGESELYPWLKLIREGFSHTNEDQALLDNVLENYKDILGSDLAVPISFS